MFPSVCLCVYVCLLVGCELVSMTESEKEREQERQSFSIYVCVYWV